MLVSQTAWVGREVSSSDKQVRQVCRYAGMLVGQMAGVDREVC